jgi:ATP-dependent Clp protease ATP-binding subunit ClpX
MPNEKTKVCIICKKPQNEVKYLIDNFLGNCICSSCLEKASSILIEAEQRLKKPNEEYLKKPHEITALLDETIIGQEDAKRELAIAIYWHYRRREVFKDGGVLLDGERIEVEKNNILLLGPSGTGKTLLAKTIAKMLSVPFYIADCTRLTQAGYVGDDVETILQGLLADSKQNIESAQWGIVFLDEFDKLARKSGRSAAGYRDITGEGVQQALLKLLEGSKTPVPRGGMGAKIGMAPTDVIDTTNILFIAAGSFAGIEEIIDRRINKSSGIGFNKNLSKNLAKTEIYKNVTTEDVEEFGLIPEIVGRIPIITSTYELSEEELVRILVEPKNAICKQFRALFSLDGINLTFSQEALKGIARLAKKRTTGARALRSILEEVLKPYAYSLHSSDLTEISITETQIKKIC